MTEESAETAGVLQKQRCPICLEDFDDKTFIDPCFHCFCFPCIVQWSEVTTTCPMCKTSFATLIHNVEANDKYTQYEVKRKEKSSSLEVSLGEARRFRYRTTRVPGQARAPLQQTNQRESGREQSEERKERERKERERRERRERRRIASQQMSNPASDERRRVVYSLGLWAQPPSTGGRKERVREISAAFFKQNLACTHRLIPWLTREFRVLLGPEHVQFMIQLVLSLISKINLEGDEFSEHLQPFLLTRTTHFLHEFVSFARSPFNMPAYDNSVQYDWPNRDNWDPEATVNVVTEQLQHTPQPGPSGLSSEEIQERLFYELTATRWDDSPPFLHLPSSPILVHGSDSESDGGESGGNTTATDEPRTAGEESVHRPHNTIATDEAGAHRPQNTTEPRRGDCSAGEEGVHRPHNTTATDESMTTDENASASGDNTDGVTGGETASTTGSNPCTTSVTSATISTTGSTGDGDCAQSVHERNTPNEAGEEDDEGGREGEEGGTTRQASEDEGEIKGSSHSKECHRSQQNVAASRSDLLEGTEPPVGEDEAEACIVINAEGEIEEGPQTVSSVAASGSLRHRRKDKRPIESSQHSGTGMPVSSSVKGMDHGPCDETHKSGRRKTRKTSEEKGKSRKGKERQSHSHKRHSHHSSDGHTSRYSRGAEHRCDDHSRHRRTKYHGHKSGNYSSSEYFSDTEIHRDFSSSRKRDHKRKEFDASRDRYCMRDKYHRSRLYSDDYVISDTSTDLESRGSVGKKRAVRDASPRRRTSSTVYDCGPCVTGHEARHGKRRDREGAKLRKELSSLDEEIVKHKKEVLRAALRSERIKLLHRQLQGEDLPDNCSNELDHVRKPLVINETTPTGEVVRQLADLDRAIENGKRRALHVMKKMEERATTSDLDSS